MSLSYTESNEFLPYIELKITVRHRPFSKQIDNFQTLVKVFSLSSDYLNIKWIIDAKWSQNFVNSHALAKIFSHLSIYF